jgi:hypothetical protein
MTDQIPDDVVERAWIALDEESFHADKQDPYGPMMRAVGRVFVEWERQRLLGEVRHLEEDGLNGGWRMRTAKEIEAAMEKLKK